jgi:hypothetical protein
VVCVSGGASPSTYFTLKVGLQGIFYGIPQATALEASRGGATWRRGVRGTARGLADPRYCLPATDFVMVAGRWVPS